LQRPAASAHRPNRELASAPVLHRNDLTERNNAIERRRNRSKIS
jgi:hypothetical protein